MNSHTPQEWADITGCYVVRDQLRERFTLFKNKPEINHEEGLWCQAGDWGELPVGAVPKEFRALDWTTLYEPRKADNAPHQSDVFIHQEYVLLGEFQPNILMEKVNEFLKDGFRLYGNPWTGPDIENYGYIHYQAMVRDACEETGLCDNCPFYRMAGDSCPFSNVPSSLTDEEIEKIIYQGEEE